MNTTTAIRRNLRPAPQDIRLPAGPPGGMLPAFHEAPGHDFLVLNQRPDLTLEHFPGPAPAAPQKK